MFIDSSLSRSMIGNLATIFDVNEYDQSYYTNMFKLLDQDVSPHYIGAQFDTLTQNGQVCYNYETVNINQTTEIIWIVSANKATNSTCRNLSQ